MNARLESPYLRLAQAAAYLNVSETTFRVHVAPKVTKHRVGARVLYARSDLDAYMEGDGARVDSVRRQPSKRSGSAHSAARTKSLQGLVAELERGAAHGR